MAGLSLKLSMADERSPYSEGAREIEIDGVTWWRPKGHDPSWYVTDYYKMVDEIKKDGDYLGWYANTIQHDLYFILFFILKIPGHIKTPDGVVHQFAHHPYVIQRCKEVQLGPTTNTLDLWFRGGFKSTIITQCEIIQKLAKDPTRRIALFSHSKAWCLRSFFHPIKRIFEESLMLKACFPRSFYNEPTKEAWKWSDEHGLFLRGATGAREASLGAYGLIDAMPTGGHFTDLYYDDIMVEELKDSPDQIQKLKHMFDMSLNLTTLGSQKRIVGTTYVHDDVYEYLQNKADPISGVPIYSTRIVPATDDGTISGASVFIPESELAELKANRQNFNSQQLLNPTPLEDAELNWERIVVVDPKDLPKRLTKFLLIDPAGERKDKRRGDAWAIGVIAFDFMRDTKGFPNCYILDAVVDMMNIDDALKHVVEMYVRNGRIAKVCVERVGMSTMEIHVKNALASRGKHVSIESKTLHLLNPAKRSKEFRIVSNVQHPLNNSKIHILSTVRPAYVARLKTEMQKFPHWHDDFLDIISYSWDVAKLFPMGRPGITSEEKVESAWDKAFREDRNRTRDRDWMIV